MKVDLGSEKFAPRSSMMKVFVLACFYFAGAYARGAGRAFPVDGENYAIDAFQKINRNIELDPTNFLVDLSGQYANCDGIGTNGFVSIPDLTEDGRSIGGYVTDTVGDRSDVNSVNRYISEVIDDWMYDRSEVYQQIRNAEFFGCSVRPACRGRVVIACLFSPSYGGFPQGDEPPKISGGQKALAFTEEQYLVAEEVTGEKWGRDHFLENLSGFETKCEMLVEESWEWTMARLESSKRKINIVPQFKVARNRGATEPAMVEALKGMKQIKGKALGCSIIPDCMVKDEMWVVVGCVLQV